MVSMKRSAAGALLLLLPVLVSAAGGLLGSWPLMASAFALIPVVIALTPVCRTFENMWSFILVFAVMPAPGITALLLFRPALENLLGSTPMWAAASVLLYLDVLAAAQIVCGAVVRRLWKRQKGFLKR